MLKIQVEGQQKKIQSFVENFKKHYQVLTVSKPYKNRNSEYVRVYVEIGPKEA